MPNIDKHASGSFSWIELATTDQTAAKVFYSGLFGWQPADFPITGSDQVYTIFQIEGRDAAAGYTIHGPMAAQGVPPHWGLYVATASADASAKRVTAAGGKVLADPFDVSDFGRMAVFQDPTGANFAVWQAGKNIGTGIAGVPGTLCWADLSTPDQAAAAAFYAAVFGWEATPGQDTSGYLHIKNGEAFIGGIPAAHQRNANVPPHWIAYFQVSNCDTSVAKAKELGAAVFMEPFTMDGVGRMAVVADPQGAVFSVFQPMPHQ
jgi:predicted enzyme related to lactoylglutathione lyase